jgi:hypothetical protein
MDEAGMSSATASNQVVPGRRCGSCTLCCKVLAITELQKPRGTWCPDCSPGKGCNIYETRPAECRSFMCGWLTDPMLGPEWKPDRSKIVLTLARDGNGIEVRCDPGFPNAWRRDPYHGTILQWCAVARAHGDIVIVCVGAKMTIIAPEGEFPLGEVRDDDRIVPKFSGRKLVGVSVVKAKTMTGRLSLDSAGSPAQSGVPKTL